VFPHLTATSGRRQGSCFDAFQSTSLSLDAPDVGNTYSSWVWPYFMQQEKGARAVADAWDATCKTCHADADRDPKKIRIVHTSDYDGDGNTTEPLAAEIDGLAAKVLAAMQAVAPLCYDGNTYPYFFKDTNGDKQCAATETVSSNGFTAFTPALMKASFNYQLSRKEPGAWAHNFDYMAQLLYDGIADLGGSVTGLTRP